MNTVKSNRPYLLVEPKKIDDTNDYIKISRNGNKISRYLFLYGKKFVPICVDSWLFYLLARTK
ncbi:MAG: hypothetical protein PHP01_05045 [Phycisphaerae bacterium]|nr:hypothetical protein [Phycisphaerae bacterium]